MSVFVVNSPLFREKNPLYDEDALPPIGLGLIATALKIKGVQVELLDAVALNISVAEIVKSVQDSRPEFICINIFTTNFELVKDIVESIEFDTHFILGGLSTKSLKEAISEWNTNRQIDIVHGDGELIVPDIVFNCVQENPSWENNNCRFYGVYSDSVYYVKDISEDKLDRSFFVNEPTIHPFGFTEANIITSRGCIYNCAFCAAASSLSREFGIREKSEKSIIDELDRIQNLYPNLQSIRVLDDLFLKTNNCVEKAIRVFNKSGLNWRSMAHVQTFKGVDKNTLKLLKDSGCNELFIGIESGSPRILKQIHKTPNVETIMENLTNLLDAGISIKGYFIFGFPGETLEDMQMTFDLAKYFRDFARNTSSKFRTSVFQFRPYHGTELFHNLEKYDVSERIASVDQIEPNSDLSALVGRLQFNFHSGNYSDVDLERVHDFIYETTNLNVSSIFTPNGQNYFTSKSNRSM